MKKTVYYEYLGTNGVICSPVHLEDTYYIRKILLIADEGKLLKRNDMTSRKSALVSEEEVELWQEIDEGQI